MTRQQELELLAEWLGVEKYRLYDSIGDNGGIEEQGWNPLTNDTDFLNMVAGRVDFEFTTHRAIATTSTNYSLTAQAKFADHNNSEYLAMKHAAYQVCLMAAGEGKE